MPSITVNIEAKGCQQKLNGRKQPDGIRKPARHSNIRGVTNQSRARRLNMGETLSGQKNAEGPISPFLPTLPITPNGAPSLVLTIWLETLGSLCSMTIARGRSTIRPTIQDLGRQHHLIKRR